MTSINIFEDEVTTNQMSFRPESSLVTRNELMPPNQTEDRFQQNALLNGKTKYEESNTIIQSLEEEIVRMKHKMSFVYEKDEEIAKLKDETHQLKKKITELETTQADIVMLRLTNQKLVDQLEELQTKKTKTTETDSTETDASAETVEDYMSINAQTVRNVLMKRLQDKQKQHINKLITEYGLDTKSKVKRSVMQQMLEKAIHL